MTSQIVHSSQRPRRSARRLPILEGKPSLQYELTEFRDIDTMPPKDSHKGVFDIASEYVERLDTGKNHVLRTSKRISNPQRQLINFEDSFTDKLRTPLSPHNSISVDSINLNLQSPADIEVKQSDERSSEDRENQWLSDEPGPLPNGFSKLTSTGLSDSAPSPPVSAATIVTDACPQPSFVDVQILVHETALAGRRLCENGGRIDETVMSHISNAFSQSMPTETAPHFDKIPEAQKSRPRKIDSSQNDISFSRNPFLHPWESASKHGWRLRKRTFLESLAQQPVIDADKPFPDTPDNGNNASNRTTLARRHSIPRRMPDIPPSPVPINESTKASLPSVQPCLLGFRSAGFKYHPSERELLLLWP